MGLDGTLYSQRSRKMMVLIQFGLVTLDWCVQKIKKSTLYINIIAWACVRLTAPAPMSVVFLDNIAFSKATNVKTIIFSSTLTEFKLRSFLVDTLNLC